MIFSLFMKKKNPKSSPKKAAKNASARPIKKGQKSEPLGFKLKKWSFVSIGVCLLILTSVAFVDGWFSKGADKTSKTFSNMMRAAGFMPKDVYLNGHHYTTVNEVLKCLDLKRGMPITSVDIQAVRTKIMGLPWVEEATLQRRYPQTLFIDIKEKKPLALWQNNKKFSIVGEDGDVITSSISSDHRNLPVVIGVNAPKHAPKLIKELDAYPTIMKKVKAFTRQGDRRWDIHYDSGLIVKLPDFDMKEALYRLDRFEKKKSIRLDHIQIIDLRNPNQLIVKLTPKAQKLYSARGSHA